MVNRRANNGCLPFIIILGLFIQAFSWLMYLSEENKANHTPLYVVISVAFTICLIVIWYWSGKAPATQSPAKVRNIILTAAGILVLALLILHMMLTVCS